MIASLIMGFFLLWSLPAGAEASGTTQTSVKGNIFAEPTIPWEKLENGWRRKVLFSGQLTFVTLQATGPSGAGIELHSHVNDQISYVIQGDIEVQVGEEVRKIGPGGFFRVPPDIPHGIRVLSEEAILVDAFTPPREDFRKQP